MDHTRWAAAGRDRSRPCCPQPGGTPRAEGLRPTLVAAVVVLFTLTGCETGGDDAPGSSTETVGTDPSVTTPGAAAQSPRSRC